MEVSKFGISFSRDPSSGSMLVFSEGKVFKVTIFTTSPDQPGWVPPQNQPNRTEPHKQTSHPEIGTLDIHGKPRLKVQPVVSFEGFGRWLPIISRILVAAPLSFLVGFYMQPTKKDGF